jgi:hypothetical protein
MIAGQLRLYDQIHDMLNDDEVAGGLYLLAGILNSLQLDQTSWPASRQAFRAHRLHEYLLNDPYTAHAFVKPRGYPGDAALIDLIYDRRLPSGTSAAGARLFEITTDFPVARAVRRRREIARRMLTEACERGARVCVLACGHLREADALAGADLANVTAVDQDELSLAVVAERHGERINLVRRNVIGFLRAAARAGDSFDLVYTLGLTDYLDDRTMALLLSLAARCLAPEGRMFLANFRPQHLASGWIDACMDWHLVCRDEVDLARHAEDAGLRASTFIDESAAIAYCEMRG